MDMKIVGITVAILVSITVLAGVLMPVLDDATATTDTYTNEGYYYMTDTTTSHTYVFDGSKWTIDGEVLNHTLTGINMIATDTFFIRDIGQVRGAYNISGITACNLTVSSGHITGTYTQSGDPVSVDWTFSTFYGATTEKAGYIMSKNTNSPVAYLTGDSDVFGYGLTNLGGNSVTFQITGNKNDGITVTCPVSAVTISDVSFNATAVDDHVDLWAFQSITFTATLNGTDYDVTYNIIVVPSEVTAERSVHFTDNQNALLAVIPMLVIVAILIGVVALVIRSRLD